MFQLQSIKMTSDVNIGLEEYDQAFVCCLEEEGNAIKIEGFFHYKVFDGKIRARIEIYFGNLILNSRKRSYDFLQDSLQETEEFKTFLKTVKGLEQLNKEKYKPILQYWETLSVNEEQISLLIHLESINVPFEIRFAIHEGENSFSIYPYGDEKRNTAYKSYIGWSEDVFHEVKTKTPYRMYFIV